MHLGWVNKSRLANLSDTLSKSGTVSKHRSRIQARTGIEDVILDKLGMGKTIEFSESLVD